ncbi:hypothetical protein [Rhizobium tubonense]|uniref:Uncharacterized protein n=1 Tax=Rhizobium tubonense TaxID=484088 RepID=A0A2W4C5R8_9HYPH|nr:hypothetical protein [Rhizobium tubonense]PZM08421.1 hypothetical protein CPY51_28520 [Rhizobium tubonense]
MTDQARTFEIDIVENWLLPDDDADVDAPDTKKPKDSPFSPWRFAKTAVSKAIIADAIVDIERYEGLHGLRKRKRKKDDQETFELTVEAILCDLMHHKLYLRLNGIYVTRSKDVLGRRNRYRPRVLGKTFTRVLDMLAKSELAWIEQDIGDGYGEGARRTTIRPGPRLTESMVDLNMAFADLGFHGVNETVILKNKKTDFWDKADVIDYEDTEDTIRFRREMQEINDWLRNADLDYGSFQGETSPIPDTDERALRRIFTRGELGCGGRLFDGFWQGMSKEDRFDRLVIDGEAIAELDYSQMSARQLHGMKGVLPPSGDLYVIPGFEEYRSDMKTVFNAMVFSDKPLTRMPRGVGKKFQKGTKITDITEAIKRHHPAIADLFFEGIGHRIQFQESQIMVDILLKLKRLGIVALPIHDAILVATSAREAAGLVMLDVFSYHVGLPGMVDVSLSP